MSAVVLYVSLEPSNILKLGVWFDNYMYAFPTYIMFYQCICRYIYVTCNVWVVLFLVTHHVLS